MINCGRSQKTSTALKKIQASVNNSQRHRIDNIFQSTYGLHQKYKSNHLACIFSQRHLLNSSPIRLLLLTRLHYKKNNPSIRVCGRAY